MRPPKLKSWLPLQRWPRTRLQRPVGEIQIWLPSGPLRNSLDRSYLNPCLYRVHREHSKTPPDPVPVQSGSRGESALRDHDFETVRQGSRETTTMMTNHIGNLL
jgi:hypothetical protein